MATPRKYVQGRDYFLAGSGISSTDTTIKLKTMNLPNSGAQVTMAMFGGVIGYATLEPEIPTREENISFTSITHNADGTVDIGGVTRGLNLVYPYTQDIALRQPHVGSTIFRITNPVQLYDQFGNKLNDEIVTGLWNFPGTTASGRPQLASDADATLDTELITHGEGLRLQGVIVQDEGTPLATRGTTLNFVGAGVTASGAGATKTITIPGGGGGGQASIQFEDEGVNLGTSGTATEVDFVGAGVTASRTSDKITVTIPGGGSSLDLETNGTPNGDQTLLNLVEGSGMSITDDGVGNITFDTIAASLEVQQNGVTVETGVDTINILGNATVTNPSAGQVDIQILGGSGGGIYNSGQTDGSSAIQNSVQQHVITHNLGVIPTLITFRVENVSSIGGGGNSVSGGSASTDGVSTIDSQQSILSGDNVPNNTSNTAIGQAGGNGSSVACTLIAFDANTFTVEWSATFNVNGTPQYVWEVYAPGNGNTFPQFLFAGDSPDVVSVCSITTPPNDPSVLFTGGKNVAGDTNPVITRYELNSSGIYVQTHVLSSTPPDGITADNGTKIGVVALGNYVYIAYTEDGTGLSKVFRVDAADLTNGVTMTQSGGTIGNNAEKTGCFTDGTDLYFYDNIVANGNRRQYSVSGTTLTFVANIDFGTNELGAYCDGVNVFLLDNLTGTIEKRDLTGALVTTYDYPLASNTPNNDTSTYGIGITLAPAGLWYVSLPVQVFNATTTIQHGAYLIPIDIP